MKRQFLEELDSLEDTEDEDSLMQARLMDELSGVMDESLDSRLPGLSKPPVEKPGYREISGVAMSETEREAMDGDDQSSGLRELLGYSREGMGMPREIGESMLGQQSADQNLVQDAIQRVMDRSGVAASDSETEGLRRSLEEDDDDDLPEGWHPPMAR